MPGERKLRQSLHTRFTYYIQWQDSFIGNIKRVKEKYNKHAYKNLEDLVLNQIENWEVKELVGPAIYEVVLIVCANGCIVIVEDMAQGQTTPYLGSRISLISKSEIRYEGILYTVDTKESTIALAKVKSFGTEDRPTEHPVAPRDEIYEYIIFKASDIKDLMVRETPKPVPQLCPGLPYDPAIVSVSQQPGSLTASMAPGGPIYHGSKPIGVSGSSSRTGSPEINRGTSPTVDSSVQTGRGAVGSGRGQGRGQQQTRPRGASATRSNPNNYRTNNAYQSNQGGQQHFGGNYRSALVNSTSRGHQTQGGYGRGRGGMGGPRQPFVGPPRGGRGGYNPSRARSSSQPRLKFDEEYDFEKANEQFKETLKTLPDALDSKTKLGAGDEVDVVVQGDSGNETHEAESEDAGSEEDKGYYDKTSSFFDNISCEALERQQEAVVKTSVRPHWRKERELNTETFGQSAVRHYQYRRGMSARGGGFYRGRGRGYYNNGYAARGSYNRY